MCKEIDDIREALHKALRHIDAHGLPANTEYWHDDERQELYRWFIDEASEEAREEFKTWVAEKLYDVPLEDWNEITLEEAKRDALVDGWQEYIGDWMQAFKAA